MFSTFILIDTLALLFRVDADRATCHHHQHLLPCVCPYQTSLAWRWRLHCVCSYSLVDVDLLPRWTQRDSHRNSEDTSDSVSKTRSQLPTNINRLKSRSEPPWNHKIMDTRFECQTFNSNYCSFIEKGVTWHLIRSLMLIQCSTVYAHPTENSSVQAPSHSIFILDG